MKKYNELRLEQYSYHRKEFPELLKITSPYSCLKAIFYMESNYRSHMLLASHSWYFAVHVLAALTSF